MAIAECRGIPKFVHGVWRPVGAPGMPHTTKGYFHASFSCEQEQVDIGLRKFLSGFVIDARHEALPVCTGEVRDILGNKMVCIGPETDAQRGVIWMRDFTYPLTESSSRALVCAELTTNEKARIHRESLALNQPDFKNSFKPDWTGKTVVLICGGPSLLSYAKFLRRENKGKDTIWVCVGRVPDVVSDDVFDYWLFADWKFSPKDIKDVSRYSRIPNYLCYAAARHETIAHIGMFGRTAWYAPCIRNPWLQVWNCNEIEVGMNGSSCVLTLAYEFGAARVVMFANEMSFSPEHPSVYTDKTTLRWSKDKDDPVCQGKVWLDDQLVMRYPGIPLEFVGAPFGLHDDIHGNAVVVDLIMMLTAAQHEAASFVLNAARADGRRSMEIVNATGCGIIKHEMQLTTPEEGLLRIKAGRWDWKIKPDFSVLQKAHDPKECEKVAELVREPCLMLP